MIRKEAGQRPPIEKSIEITPAIAGELIGMHERAERDLTDLRRSRQIFEGRDRHDARLHARASAISDVLQKIGLTVPLKPRRRQSNNAHETDYPRSEAEAAIW